MARPKTVHAPLVATEVSINPASRGTLTGAEETVTVAGLVKGYPVVCWTLSDVETGLIFSNFRCVDSDTLKYNVFNATAGTVNGAALMWKVVQF